MLVITMKFYFIQILFGLFSLLSSTVAYFIISVILSQIVMVSPGTHLANKSYVPLQNHSVQVQKSEVLN